MRADPGALSRRAVSVPAYVLAFALAFALSPLLLLAALLFDAVRGSRLGATRGLALVLAYLAAEMAGIVASVALWAAGRSQDLHQHSRLQAWWAGGLFRLTTRLLAMPLKVEGAECLQPGPYLLFLRHASVADTLLPAGLIAATQGTRFRYVLKRELLWDPCLDIVGNRLPNVFVRRDGAEPAELAQIEALPQGMAADEAALIFPEGTRASPERRARALAKLEGTPLHEVAARLEHVLPPRLGGALALLQGAPKCDVVFCAHAGLDAVRTLGDLWNGKLVGRTLHVGFWRVPRAQIPLERDARAAWLLEQWTRVDRWVGAHQA